MKKIYGWMLLILVILCCAVLLEVDWNRMSAANVGRAFGNLTGLTKPFSFSDYDIEKITSAYVKELVQYLPPREKELRTEDDIISHYVDLVSRVEFAVITEMSDDEIKNRFFQLLILEMTLDSFAHTIQSWARPIEKHYHEPGFAESFETVTREMRTPGKILDRDRFKASNYFTFRELSELPNQMRLVEKNVQIAAWLHCGSLLNN